MNSRVGRKENLLRVIAWLDRGSIAKLALGPPVLMEELVLAGISVTVYPDNREGNGDIGIIDRSRRLVEAVHSTNEAIFARGQRPRPFAFGPVRFENLYSSSVSNQVDNSFSAESGGAGEDIMLYCGAWGEMIDLE